MLMFPTCPHCQKAISLVAELKEENPQYSGIEITMIDEKLNAEEAEKYDYYYVPTYFVDGVKIHEGKVEKEDIERVLQAAIS